MDRSFAPFGFPRRETGVGLLYGDAVESRPWLVLLDSGIRRRVVLGQGYSGEQYQAWEASPFYGDLIRVGDRLVYSVVPKNGAAPAVVYSQPTDFSRAPLRLIGSPQYFAARRSGAVWVHGPHGTQFVELDADTGAVLDRSAPMPPRGNVVAEFPNGFLVGRTDHAAVVERYQLVGVHTGQVVRTLTRTAAELEGLLGVGAHAIAWRPARCLRCALHVTDTRTGHDRRIELPPTTGGLCASGSFSPDSQRLAVIYSCPRRGAQDGLVLINLRDGHAQFVHRTHDSNEGGPYWSPDGHWLFWSGQHDREGFVTTLAYRLDSRTPIRFPTTPRSGLVIAIDFRN